jgi:hypothetical protein
LNPKSCVPIVAGEQNHQFATSLEAEVIDGLLDLLHRSHGKKLRV